MRRRLIPAPGSGNKEHQHGEDFQSAHQHVEAENQFAEIREGSIVPDGSHHVHAGTDVIEAGHHSRHIGFQGEFVHSDQQHGERGDQSVHREVAVGALDGVLVYQLAVHMHLRNGTGTQHAANVAPGCFKEECDAGCFDAASGGTRTGSENHQQHQQHFGENRPEVEIHRSKTGGSHDGRNRKRHMVEGLSYISVKIGQGVDCDEGDGAEHNQQVKSQLLVAEHPGKLPEQEQVENAEIDAEQGHEYSAYRLQIGAIPGHTVVPDTEAARARRTESGAETVEQRHSACQQKDDLNEGEGNVDGIQDFGAVLEPGNQFVYLWPGAFRPHHMQQGVLAAPHGHHCQKKYKHAHAAQPMGKASPVEQPHGHGLHVSENTGAGGGETGNRLENAVDKIRDGPADEKGKRPEQGNGDPGKGDAEKALPCANGLGFHPEKKGGKAAEGTEKNADSEAQHRGSLVLINGNQQAGNHTHRFNAKDNANEVKDHSAIHGVRLPPRRFHSDR